MTFPARSPSYSSGRACPPPANVLPTRKTLAHGRMSMGRPSSMAAADAKLATTPRPFPAAAGEQAESAAGGNTGTKETPATPRAGNPRSSASSPDAGSIQPDAADIASPANGKKRTPESLGCKLHVEPRRGHGSVQRRRRSDPADPSNASSRTHTGSEASPPA